MYWADELAAAASGPQIVNDSKSPSGTVHVGSLRGVVLHDAIYRALRRRRRRGPTSSTASTTWTPWIRRRSSRPTRSRSTWARRSRACRRPPGARPRATPAISSARSSSGPSSRWASSPSSTGSASCTPPARWTATSGSRWTGRIASATSTGGSATWSAPPSWLPIQVVCENCGKIGTTYATDWDGETVSYACQPDLVAWAARLRSRRPGIAAGRPGQAALEPRVGGQVGPVRRHDRGLRQGPRHGRWLARPLGRHRPRGLRGRAAQERGLRVPQRRRQEDVHVEGPGRGRSHHRRGPPAGAAPLPLPSAAAEPGDRLRSGRRHDPAPLRRVRSHRRRHGRPRGQGRAAGGLRAAVRLLAAGRAGPSPRRPPPSGPPSPTSRSCCRSPAWTSRSEWRPRRARR